MIKKISAINFKAFKSIDLGLKSLNLLSGINGTGKSSIIQVLLLLRQTFQINKGFEDELNLKGRLVNIGLARDAISKYRSNSSLEFDLNWGEDDSLNCKIQYNQGISKLSILPASYSFAEGVDEKSLFNNNFEYLNALRITPNTSYEFSTYDVVKLDSLGEHGQFTLHYLDIFGSKDIDIENLMHPETENEDKSLLGQTDLWMSYISPGLNIRPSTNLNAELSQVTFSFKSGEHRTDDFKPKNVGFGITYTLPVIVAVLKSKPGDLLIIENPESHIHPRGQVWLGELFARAAESGVQIVIETHSDHIMNGIRYAAKKNLITSSNVKFYFFDRDVNSTEHISFVREPVLHQNGKVGNWTDGFFDSWDDIVFKLI